MLALRPAWEDLERVWVTLEGPDVSYLLAEESVVHGHGPTNRSLVKALRNFPFAWRTLRRHDVDAVLSTGAGLAVPFFLAARLQGRRAVYVESLTRSEGLSLTGRLVYPLARAFFVQWPSTTKLRRARHLGSVL